MHLQALATVQGLVSMDTAGSEQSVCVRVCAYMYVWVCETVCVWVHVCLVLLHHTCTTHRSQDPKQNSIEGNVERQAIRCYVLCAMVLSLAGVSQKDNPAHLRSS